MRICIDLDGVISKLKKDEENYSEVKPLEGAVEKIKSLKKNGHYIIIYTARHMKTCDGNIEKVISKIGGLTLEWLKKYEIPYDEIIFGKPWADVYIDDNALRFSSWRDINQNGSNLPISNEIKNKEKV
jgi:capsule biosynthesis phosphatase